MNDELMADIQRSLGRIEQKVDVALEWQRTHVEDDKKAFAALDAELAGIKLSRATQAGKVSVVVALLTAVAGALGGVVEWLFHRGH